MNDYSKEELVEMKKGLWLLHDSLHVGTEERKGHLKELILRLDRIISKEGK